jgi:uncharacterized membrane protein
MALGARPDPAAAQPEYFELPLPPGAVRADAIAISADGSTMVGNFTRADATIGGWRWSAAHGMATLTTAEANNTYEWPSSVTGDGSVTVGDSWGTTCTLFPAMAVKWTHGAGYELLLSDNFCTSSASFISDDGSVIAGAAVFTGPSTWWFVPAVQVNGGPWTSVPGVVGCNGVNSCLAEVLTGDSWWAAHTLATTTAGSMTDSPPREPSFPISRQTTAVPAATS